MPAPVPVIDTIAAISTPPGRGGIGIVRLSGSQAAAIAVQLVRLPGPLEHAHARLADVLDESGDEATRDEASRIDEATRIDEAMVTYFRAPRSYTSEDLVEIATHGSPVVLELLLRRALELGARLAEPGEFTQRAFLSGRLDLTQAEAVRDLIEAQTLTQARQAASQMGGALSRRVAPVKQALVELVALLEAGIDFAEDDLEVTPGQEIARRIAALTPPLAALEASFARGRIVHDGLTLAIVGRPNAGKSSLFNRLVERDRAIVTATPGTTRDLVTERISIEGIPLELVDTAGLREGPRSSLDEAEQLGIARSREALADAALVLIVLDATQPLNDEEHRLLAAVEGRRRSSPSTNPICWKSRNRKNWIQKKRKSERRNLKDPVSQIRRVRRTACPLLMQRSRLSTPSPRSQHRRSPAKALPRCERRFLPSPRAEPRPSRECSPISASTRPSLRRSPPWPTRQRPTRAAFPTR